MARTSNLAVKNQDNDRGDGRMAKKVEIIGICKEYGVTFVSPVTDEDILLETTYKLFEDLGDNVIGEEINLDDSLTRFKDKKVKITIEEVLE